ncbi:sensor histidine kinase [Aquiflexum gelatinilyticum]|uniref:histidine kinase n=1 Tax=Aquiflexum gelatinilyticum TaxID=2961943 RepID=A0A9X2T0A7_9BACT|nr:sensor histidine kinase [Aquiflexum gelatinilyticum]MCR9015438.1 sensor histidine kinase [Aquiflexum gelatinilyticum]
MLIGHLNQLKLTISKYPYFFIFAFIIFNFSTLDCYAQKPHIEGGLFKEGLLELKFKENWKYQPGDNIEWAKPDFDDSNWYNLNPIELKAYQMPDSLWSGYGWWRISFTADPKTVAEIERLYFYSWGAAEIYLDGELVASFGNFSPDSKNEKTYSPNYAGDRPLKISPNDLHTLAVRFSNHQAKTNHQIFRYFSENLGFNIGFSNSLRAEYSDFRYANSFATLSVIVVVLSILLLLHVLLYIKFRKEEPYLVITLITFFFLCAAICAHILLFVDLNGFTNPIFSGILNSTAFGLGYSFLPYSLSSLFRIKKFYWTKHLVWLALLRTANYFVNVFNFILFDATIILAVIILMVVIMRIAIREKNKGALYVTFGAVGTSVFLLVNRMVNADIISLSTSLYYLDLILLYISYPLGIYIYITNQYGRLFLAMEQEVEERTHQLNAMVLNLTKTQKELSTKNDENVLLLKEIHHRVKNNLEVVSGLLALQFAKIDDPNMQEVMLSSQNRVKSMGILHQKLYQSEQLAFIEMKNYFENLCENILDSYNETDRIKVDIEMKEIELDVDTAVPLGLIVNELLTNSLKYAFPKGVKGKIELSLKNVDNDNFQLKISDNGVGKPLFGKAIGTGFGSQLVDLLTRQIDGKLIQDVSNGTLILINFERQATAKV